MNQQEILSELRTIVANNQEYTTWTVSTPHLVALVNKCMKAERDRILAVIGDNQCECRCAEVVRERGETK